MNSTAWMRAANVCCDEDTEIAPRLMYSVNICRVQYVWLARRTQPYIWVWIDQLTSCSLKFALSRRIFELDLSLYRARVQCVRVCVNLLFVCARARALCASCTTTTTTIKRKPRPKRRGDAAVIDDDKFFQKFSQLISVVNNSINSIQFTPDFPIWPTFVQTVFLFVSF